MQSIRINSSNKLNSSVENTERELSIRPSYEFTIDCDKLEALDDFNLDIFESTNHFLFDSVVLIFHDCGFCTGKHKIEPERVYEFV